MSMSGNTTLPSAAVKVVGEAEPSQESKREDWRKAKELEEARKAGTAPALTDETGKDINPHIPQYISTVPWYVGFDHPTLKHQRVQPEKIKKFSGIDEWYKRGVKKASHVTKFQKGACTNCGALTHKKKDCVERPRKVGAKYTGEKIAPEEFLQPSLSFDYDGKRDRWNGYDPNEHERVIQEFAKVEEAKKHLKVKKLYDDMLSGQVEPEDIKGEGSDKEDDEDKYADDFDMPGTNFDSKRRITVRNLRIREDTAKYLYNLDLNSAYYDPKTRSMRENPFNDGNSKAGITNYSGDNFIRSAGETQEMANAQLFAWDAERKGTDVHLQADPTKLELLHRQFVTKKDDFKKNQKGSILSRYGGAEHLEAPPKELLLAQTENYVEYSKHGTVLKGQEKAKVKSRYEEDVYHNNHTSVWGSFWKEGQWGYACCHSFVKMSYCTGAAGKVADEEDILAIEDEKPPTPEKSLLEQHKDKIEKEKAKQKKKNKKKAAKKKSSMKNGKQKRKSSDSSSSSDTSSSDSSSSDSSDSSDSENEEAIRQKKIKEAMKKQERLDREADRILAMDERKRPYNSMRSFESYKEPTEEEMEAFRMKRKRTDDPMADFITK